MRFDLSAVLWIVTATDRAAVPKGMHDRLEVIELPHYTEPEKLAIAEQYLLKRPFDEPVRASVACLAPVPASPSVGEAVEGSAVLVERDVTSLDELQTLSAGAPFPGAAADAWRTAACTGAVRFEREAIRLVVRDHTDEAGVVELSAKLAELCHVMMQRPHAEPGPEVITPAVVREVLGEGAVDTLPPAVRAAIAGERRRLSAIRDKSDKSEDDAEPTNDWIEWLEQLPWTRRSRAPIDLARTRAALDGGHAGLEHAKGRILEYLAVRRRNPLGGGAVLCFAGPPGGGKTSLAQCTAAALGRGFVKLSCGGLHDETDLRGHNRTWKNSQPGAILREMRRVGSKDPVFVLDELDKLGPAPAAVLLEVLDPAQNEKFRDAFVELPFDLSEVLFITTANETARIPAALRDRLEIIDLPGYTEAEKIAIAETHLVGAQNRAAGLTAKPVRLTRGACRRIIRDYTSERGVRQLARCLETICRKVALGLETGDSSLVGERITAARVRGFLGAPGVDHTDGLDRFRAQLDAPALPEAVRVRGREVLGRLAGLRTHDPEHAQGREHLQCLTGLPWTKRTAPAPDLARAKALLDEGYAAHGAVKEKVVDYIAVRLAKPDSRAPLLCLVGPPGVGKTWVAALVAAALKRECAWVACGELGGAADVHGARSGRPGRIVDEVRRVGVRDPVFVLDEIDRLDEKDDVAAALLDALDPTPDAPFRDRYVDLPFDLSEALFVATATNLGRVPAVLREGMLGIELPGYTEAEKRRIASRHLLPMRMKDYGLTTEKVRVTDDAIGAIIRGYTREAGVWRLADALGTVCAKVVRRRAEGDEAPVAVTPQTLVGDVGCADGPQRRGRRPYRAARCRCRPLLDARWRRPALCRGRPHAGVGCAHPDRAVGGGDAGIGAGGGVVAAGQRETVRRRPGLPPGHRRASARAVRQRAEGGGLGRRHDGGRAGVGVHPAGGPRRRGHDRRGDPLRSRAAGRRHQGQGAGRARVGAGPRHPAAAEPQAGRRGTRRRPPACSHRRLCGAGRRGAGDGAASRPRNGRTRRRCRPAGCPEPRLPGGRVTPVSRAHGRTRTAMAADEHDKNSVPHIYTVENLYAAVVEAYIQWRTALVEAVLRASLSAETTMHLRGHQLCIRRLASLLQVASAYRHGRQWRCECHYCLFMWGLRNYLAHHWARDGAEFAISGGRWSSGSIWTRQHNAPFDHNRGYLRTYAPQVRIAAVRKTLKKRRRFDAAARALADGAPRCRLVPVVDGYLRCLSANCAEWRAANPVPEPDGREHGYPRTELLKLAGELRQASSARPLGGLGLVGGA